MDLNQVVGKVVLTKVCSIKADADSNTSKNISLEVDFSGSTLRDVFTKAMAGVVIQWQNGPGRKHYDQWKHGQVVKIDFKAPATTTIDPETAMVDKLKSMTEEERLAYLQELMSKAQ